jgi:plastocyanin
VGPKIKIIQESTMSKNSDASNLSRRKFLAVAGTVAAANSLAVGKDVGSAQTTTQSTPVSPVHYLVTITVDVANNSISYDALNKDTGKPAPMPNNSLTVMPGDEVKWTARTSGHRYRASVRFTTTTPFAVKEFKWSENQTGGGNTQGGAANHYYLVAVFDKDTQEVYSDDPKIIVGGASVKAEIIEAESELQAVKEKIDSIDAILNNAIGQL